MDIPTGFRTVLKKLKLLAPNGPQGPRDFYKLIDLEISCRGPWLKHSELSYASSYGPGRFSGFCIEISARAPKWDPNGPHFPGGSAPRPPFSRPSASKWVPGPRPIPLNGSLKNGSDHSYFPKNPVSFFSRTDLEFWPSPIFFGGRIWIIQTETVWRLEFSAWMARTFASL